MAKSQRAIALILALLFFATSVATTAYVIWQINNEEPVATDNEISTTPQTNNTNQTDTTSQENKLQGTQLAGFTPITGVSELQIIDTKVGDGEEVKPGASVTAHYTGAVAATGVIFQSSHDLGNAIDFSLSGVIKGWTDGVPGMKVGGTRRLVIPAAQAYGSTPPQGSGIPADADLVFDIELVGVQNP